MEWHVERKLWSELWNHQAPCSVISFMKIIFINDSSRFFFPAKVRIYCFLRRAGKEMELQCIGSGDGDALVHLFLLKLCLGMKMLSFTVHVESVQVLLSYLCDKALEISSLHCLTISLTPPLIHRSDTWAAMSVMTSAHALSGRVRQVFNHLRPCGTASL